jgi:hypothetical protein
MRTILSLSALVLSVEASAAPPELAPALDAPLASKIDSPSLLTPNVLRIPSANKEQEAANCHGRIVTARAELGLPKLADDGAKSGEPLFIAAVAKSIDGCQVLVMRNNTSDIRPLPQFQDGPGKMIPLGGQ